MALDLGDCISGCTRAAASNPARINCFTFSWISSHLTIESRIVLLIKRNTQRYEGTPNAAYTVMFLFKLSHKLCCGLVIQLPTVVLKRIREWTWKKGTRELLLYRMLQSLSELNHYVERVFLRNTMTVK